jgi:hypothetical protein
MEADFINEPPLGSLEASCKPFHSPRPTTPERYEISVFLVNQKFEILVKKMNEAN